MGKHKGFAGSKGILTCCYAQEGGFKQASFIIGTNFKYQCKLSQSKYPLAH